MVSSGWKCDILISWAAATLLYLKETIQHHLDEIFEKPSMLCRNLSWHNKATWCFSRACFLDWQIIPTAQHNIQQQIRHQQWYYATVTLPPSTIKQEHEFNNFWDSLYVYSKPQQLLVVTGLGWNVLNIQETPKEDLQPNSDLCSVNIVLSQIKVISVQHILWEGLGELVWDDPEWSAAT